MNSCTKHAIYDVAAIGLGPFNLGLACLIDPIRELDAVFLERRDGFEWHAGTLLPGTTLQTPFLSDLVTLAAPTSRFSFLNYLKQRDRLYQFYIRENFYPLRAEFDDYCRWAASQLPSIRFGHDVYSVEYDEDEDCYVVRARDTATGKEVTVRATAVVVGVGTEPDVPPAVAGLGGIEGPTSLHSATYLSRRDELHALECVTVVGSGQSAAEIVFDLLQDIDEQDRRLNWITRSPRFFPLEYTKLTLELTSPDYIDYFYGLPEETQDRLSASHKGLYKGIDGSLVNSIFDLLYEKSRIKRLPVRLLPNCTLEQAKEIEDGYELRLRQHEQAAVTSLRTGGLVLATGYRPRSLNFFEGLGEHILWDERGRLAVRRDYSVDRVGGRVFVQNAELHTHGFTAPDLGMAAYRNSSIICSLLGREYYPVERSIAFQEFAV